MIHPLADVQSSSIGDGTTIWQFAIVLKGAIIGRNCNINCHTFIENDVIIGDNVTIKSGTYVWDNIRIENNVFVGPNVVFTNDLRPRSGQRLPYPQTIIREGATLGANTTVLAGVIINRYAMSGIGSVITRDVLAHGLVYGNPARLRGWVCPEGLALVPAGPQRWVSESGDDYLETPEGLHKL